MNNTDKITTWRKVLVVINCLVIAVCLILLGNIDSVIRYDYDYHGYWYYNKSRIGNFNSDAQEVKIGERVWKKELIEPDSDSEKYGTLICFYTSCIKKCSDSHYDDNAFLWVYDISPKLQKGMNADLFYNNLYNQFSDSWKPIDAFLPFESLTTSPMELGGDNNAFYMRTFIFANERVYEFGFMNYGYERFSSRDAELFYNKCLSVISEFDFLSYHLSKKEKAQRNLLGYILFSISIFSSISIFALFFRKIGRDNLYAKKIASYWIICLLITLVLLSIGAILKAGDDYEVLLAWLLLIIPCIIVYSLTIMYLISKSKKKYYDSFLIPDMLLSSLRITSEFRKRLLMVFLIYPFFFAVPIPIGGGFVLVFYILPILLILGIIWIVMWIRDGKTIDSKQHVQMDKARLFCRHCGKLVDADSLYCRYCGKKL